jgi:hypothetical protein
MQGPSAINADLPAAPYCPAAGIVACPGHPAECLLAEGTHFTDCGVGLWAAAGAKVRLEKDASDEASSMWILQPPHDRVCLHCKDMWAHLRSAKCSFIDCLSAVCAMGE